MKCTTIFELKKAADHAIGGFLLRMPRLREKYTLANCCRPVPNDAIVGYFSHDNFVKVHAADCANLTTIDSERLIPLNWAEIIAENEFAPDTDFDTLEVRDFLVLAHHETYGFDYSLKVASMLSIDKKAVFDIHKKLRQMGLLERVDPKMIQYRKNIVPGKWIKHRNHTYYSLTDKGRAYLDYQRKKS